MIFIIDIIIIFCVYIIKVYESIESQNQLIYSMKLQNYNIKIKPRLKFTVNENGICNPVKEEKDQFKFRDRSSDTGMKIQSLLICFNM